MFLEWEMLETLRNLISMLIKDIGWYPEVCGLLIKNLWLLITDRFLPEAASQSMTQWSALQVRWEATLARRASICTAGTRGYRVSGDAEREKKQEEVAEKL